MKLFTDFLLYVAIGLVLYFIHYALRGRFLFGFKAFFIGGSVALTAYYAFGLMQVLGVTLPGWIETTLGWVVQASAVILGYCLGYMMRGVGPHYSFIIRGLSIQIGVTFVTFSLGKSLNMPDMKQFFHSSGYSVYFLYFIIILEGVTGMVLLFNLKFYPKIITLAILSAIIIGAIVTHARNGDPISDSEDAILLGTKIVLLVAVYFLYKRNIRKEAISSGVPGQ